MTSSSPSPSPIRPDDGHTDCDPTAERDALMRPAEAASFLGLTARTVDKMRQQGRGPSFVLISSRCIRYRRSDLDTWIAERVRSNTAQPAPDSPTLNPIEEHRSLARKTR